MAFWSTTVLWELNMALYSLKANTTSRTLVEVHNTSYGRAISSLLSQSVSLGAPIEQNWVRHGANSGGWVHDRCGCGTSLE
jgi:hypothetical protein